jgi:hypothetical protein
MAKTKHQVEEAFREDEAAKVLRWRIRVCLELGYTVPSAERIAASPADVRKLEQMIDDGCPLDVAKRIVL